MCAAIENYRAVEERLLKYRSQICCVMNAPSVLRWMPSFISPEDEAEIKSRDERSSEKASFLFIDKILKCTNRGKWQAFLEALERADYPYLVSLLESNGQDPENCDHQKKILQIFAPYLKLQLEPCDIITHLSASDLINATDVEEIMACQRNRGSVAATILMLDRLQRRQAPSKWYSNFLKILYQKGFKDIVHEMEPEFTLDCEVLKAPTIHVTDSSESDIEVDEYGCSVEERIESKVRFFQSEITQLVKVEKIASALCQLIGFDKICQLMQASNCSQKESIESMIEEISKLKSKTKWRSFISCLKTSDYPHLADLLSRPITSNIQCKERDLLRLFHSTIGEQLDPLDLLTHLEQDNAINHTDKEEIMNTYKHSGKTAASLALIDCFQCRLAPVQWFTAFLNALCACGRDDIVQTIDPEYLKNQIDEPEADKDQFYEDNDLINRLDAARCHVYKLEKSAKCELGKLQQHFDDKKSSLQELIEKKTTVMSKTLEHVECLIGRKSEVDIKQEIDSCLKQVLSSCYTVCPVESFTSLERLAILQESKRNTHGYTKHKIIGTRQRHLSTGSSSSSVSSGYMFVEKSTHRYSTSLSSSLDDTPKKRNAGKVTFADNNETTQELRDKTLPKPNKERPHLKFAKDSDYLEHFSRRKTFPGRRRTVSESSIISTDGSGISSIDRPASSLTEALTETSTLSSSTTRTPNAPGKNVRVERTESYLYHHQIVLNKSKSNCLFSSLCILPSNKTVLVDQSNGCFYLYDDASKKVICHRYNKNIPICVCNIGDDLLFIIFRMRNCTTILVQFNIIYSECYNPKRIVTGITFVKEVKVSEKCSGTLCSVSSSSSSVVALCSNKHMHIIGTDGKEIKCVSCDIVLNEWWPHYSKVDSDCNYAYIYDIYSCSVFCFCICTGLNIWHLRLPHVEGMTLCGESIYLSMNVEEKIEVLSRSTGEQERIITENVRHPFAVSSSPGQDTIIVTHYHPKGSKINRIIKYF